MIKIGRIFYPEMLAVRKNDWCLDLGWFDTVYIGHRVTNEEPYWFCSITCDEQHIDDGHFMYYPHTPKSLTRVLDDLFPEGWMWIKDEPMTIDKYYQYKKELHEIQNR